MKLPVVPPKAVVLGLLLLPLLPTKTAAQGPADPYPSHAIELIVPYAAGGAVSAMARLFAAEASKASGQQWTVMNREGAGGLVGFSALARARPDGYTIAFSPASPLTNAPFVTEKMPFKSEQVVPVCQVFENVFGIAVPQSSPFRSWKDLADRAAAQPGAVSYGHSGPGSVGQFSLAMVERDSRLRFNSIAYRSDAQALNDAMAGTVDFAVQSLASLAGKNLRVLAVLAEQPHPSLPDVPAIAQLGYTAVTPGLNGLFVPAGTPKSVVEQIAALCQRATLSASFAEGARPLLQVPRFLPGADFGARIDTTYRAHAALVPSLRLEKN